MNAGETVRPPDPEAPWIFDPAETLPRGELETLQGRRLRDTVARVAGVPFYRDALKKAGVDAGAIASMQDLRALPFTTKEDLRQHYPLGFLAVPREEVARIHGSSGTTGKPTFVAYTRRDLEQWANLCARFLTAGGLRPEHTVQIAFGYGLFTGGFGLHYGVERVGAAVVPAAAGNTPRQIMLMQDLGVDTLVCTPSYALNLAEYIRREGVDRATLRLRRAHLGGEPWTEDMRTVLERELDIRCFNNYGLSEVLGPGVSGECEERHGMHAHEDAFAVECLNPSTLEPVPDGEPGELVLTTLAREAMPILRYRTRDIAVLDRMPCPCGRTGVRIGRITGRTDDMLIIRGVNVFPSQIEEALLRVEGTAPHYRIEVDRPQRMDVITVQVEMQPEVFSASVRVLHELKSRLVREIQTITGLRMEVDLVEPQTLERFEGKARRVVDLRREKGLL